jgi:PAS domain S-box-containing protein
MTSLPEDSAVLQSLFEAAVDAMIVADHAGIIRRVNPAACDLFLALPEDLIGQNVSTLMTHDMASEHDGFMQTYMDTGQKRIIGTGREVEGRRSDGSVFPLHLSVGDTHLDGDRLFIAILHDLTHRKATQDALARSQRMDAIGQMVGGIVHDFNNILTVVIGNLELLGMRDPTERQIRLIRDALETAELGADLTSRLMVFARRSNLKPARVDLRDTCERTLAILRRTLGSKYTIKTRYAADRHLVELDPVQLQSALMNLALNARDAMPEGGNLLLSVNNVTIDDDYMAQEIDMGRGDYVRLSVSDDGVGMTHEAQKRAFEPFFTTKTASGCSGLGLAMVYGFVRQSGGHVTLYSELGFGTSFGLYFPALPERAEEQSLPDVVTVENRPPRGRGRTILVVEDNPRVLRLSGERIRDFGFETVLAESGDAAYEILKSGQHVDVLFSDLVMPGKLNGFGLASRVQEEFPHVRILLTSGYASDVVSRALSQGATWDVLHKPYRQAELARRLYALVGDGTETPEG